MIEHNVVRIGSRVCIRDDDGVAEFRIVESADADAFEGRVSADGPLGRALLGRRAGELVRFRAPGGVLAVTVVEVG
jgi:transcription elongation GreA/GreB family factor